MAKNRRKGFSLIELVIVIVIISVGLVGIVSQFGNNTTSLSTNETLQQATQYAQECAEMLIAKRRSNDGGFTQFKSNGSFSCGTSPFGSANAFTRQPNDAAPDIGDTYTGVAGTCNSNTPCPCPVGVLCRDVPITVTSGSLSASITVMLVDY